MTWIEEYELLFNLAYEWEFDTLIDARIVADFSEGNPYREAVQMAYKVITEGEK